MDQKMNSLSTFFWEFLLTMIVFIAVFACVHTIPMHAIMQHLGMPVLDIFGLQELLIAVSSSSALVFTWIIPSTVLAVCFVSFYWAMPNWGFATRSLSGLPIAFGYGYAIACEFLSFKHVVGQADYIVMSASILLTCATWFAGSQACFLCLKNRKVGAD